MPVGRSKALVTGAGTARREVLVLRDERRIWAFENACPHTGTPLDVFDDDVFDAAGEFLVCGTHGALFRPGDGYCVAGPCQGASLRRLAVVIVGGAVTITP